ncbi:hypothetical protein AgCh_021735 [Apium graveolens]
MLNLGHTTASMQRVKDAITAMPPKAGDDVDYETGEFEEFFGDEDGDDEEFMDIGGEAGPSSRSNIPPWHQEAFYKHTSTLYNYIKYKLFQHNQDVTSIKTEINQNKKDVSERLDAKFLDTTVLDINRQLRKNSNLATKVDSLDTRLKAVEASLTAFHLHQAQQTQLLQKLVAVQTSTSTLLDDNKNGEKDSIIPVSQGGQTSEGEHVINVQISQVIVPEITLPKPPVLDNIETQFCQDNPLYLYNSLAKRLLNQRHYYLLWKPEALNTIGTTRGKGFRLRTFRMLSSVNIYYLLANDTVDDIIWDNLNFRASWIISGMGDAE